MLTASKLRENIFKLLDSVIETGQPLEISRNGHTLKIIPEESKSKLSRLKKRKLSDEPLENFDHVDWSSEWNPKL